MSGYVPAVSAEIKTHRFDSVTLPKGHTSSVVQPASAKIATSKGTKPVSVAMLWPPVIKTGPAVQLARSILASLVCVNERVIVHSHAGRQGCLQDYRYYRSGYGFGCCLLFLARADLRAYERNDSRTYDTNQHRKFEETAGTRRSPSLWEQVMRRMDWKPLVV